MFAFEFDGYTVYPETFVYTKTRHGYRMQARVYREGNVVARLDDIPERIVAPVSVLSEAERARMVKLGRASDQMPSWPNPTDGDVLSEYLRGKTMQAEAAQNKLTAWFMGAFAHTADLLAELAVEAAKLDCVADFNEGYADMAARSEA